MQARQGIGMAKEGKAKQGMAWARQGVGKERLSQGNA
jgi:hypothetical protein